MTRRDLRLMLTGAAGVAVVFAIGITLIHEKPSSTFWLLLALIALTARPKCGEM